MRFLIFFAQVPHLTKYGIFLTLIWHPFHQPVNCSSETFLATIIMNHESLDTELKERGGVVSANDFRENKAPRFTMLDEKKIRYKR